MFLRLIFSLRQISGILKPWRWRHESLQLSVLPSVRRFNLASTYTWIGSGLDLEWVLCCFMITFNAFDVAFKLGINLTLWFLMDFGLHIEPSREISNRFESTLNSALKHSGLHYDFSKADLKLQIVHLLRNLMWVWIDLDQIWKLWDQKDHLDFAMKSLWPISRFESFRVVWSDLERFKAIWEQTPFSWCWDFV